MDASSSAQLARPAAARLRVSERGRDAVLRASLRRRTGRTVVYQRVRVEDDLLIGRRSRLPCGNALAGRVVDRNRSLGRERGSKEERSNQDNGKAAHGWPLQHLRGSWRRGFPTQSPI